MQQQAERVDPFRRVRRQPHPDHPARARCRSRRRSAPRSRPAAGSRPRPARRSCTGRAAPATRRGRGARNAAAGTARPAPPPAVPRPRGWCRASCRARPPARLRGPPEWPRPGPAQTSACAHRGYRCPASWASQLAEHPVAGQDVARRWSSARALRGWRATNSRSCSSMPLVETSTVRHVDRLLAPGRPGRRSGRCRCRCRRCSGRTCPSGPSLLKLSESVQMRPAGRPQLDGHVHRDAELRVDRPLHGVGDLDVLAGLVLEQVDGVRGVVPEQVIGPAARLAEARSGSLRRKKYVCTSICWMDSSPAAMRRWIHWCDGLNRRVCPAMQTRPVSRCTCDRPPARPPSCRRAGSRPGTCLPARIAAMACRACSWVGVHEDDGVDVVAGEDLVQVGPRRGRCRTSARPPRPAPACG